MKQRQHKFTHDMRPYPRGQVTAEELTTAADKVPGKGEYWCTELEVMQLAGKLYPVWHSQFFKR